MNDLGIMFGTVHSFNNLGLRWLGPFNIDLPDPVIKTKNIPGRDGELDYSDALTGRVAFKNRIFSTDFEIETKSTSDYIKKSSDITNALHAKRFRITLDTEPEFYYEGRVTVTPHKRKNERFADFTVEMDVFPYKRKKNLTQIHAHVVGKTTLCCNNLREPVVPVIKTSAPMNLTFKNRHVSVQSGTHLIDFVFEEGENYITAEGNGDIVIEYREGSL